jgi:N-dimethylarginine dimethylaminohydrolase
MPLVEATPDWRARAEPIADCTATLMCPPDHFAVVDVKNAFMEGQLGRVERDVAARQWHALAAVLREEGGPVHVLDALPEREDMVFTANPAVVVPRAAGGVDVVRSVMRHASRQAEVPAVARWFEARGVTPHALPPGAGALEGHGDVLLVPGLRLALGGHGGRSERPALAALADAVELPIVPLPLVGEVFYHLDTCLMPLDARTILLHPPAFRPAALDRLRVLFPHRVEADPEEARTHLACNVRALPGGVVVLPARAGRTAGRLARAGFRPVPVDVSEFHKSGGSVYCLGLPMPVDVAPAA